MNTRSERTAVPGPRPAATAKQRNETNAQRSAPDPGRSTVWFLATTRDGHIPDAFRGVYALDGSSGRITGFCSRSTEHRPHRRTPTVACTSIGRPDAGRAPLRRPRAHVLGDERGGPAGRGADLDGTRRRHWTDREAGLRELRRVSKRQVVLFFEPLDILRFWVSDYFAEAKELPSEQNAPSERLLRAVLPVREVQTVLVPHDCVDGFGAAF